MAVKPNFKCVVSFIWMNAIVVGVFVFAFFTFIDPGDIAMRLQLDVDLGMFRIKAYIGTFLVLWLMFNASTFLNCYFHSMRDKLPNCDSCS